MDMRTKRQQMSRETWQARIMARQASGKTVKSWCEAQGLTESSYYYWLRQLRQEALHSKENDCDDALVPVFCEIPHTSSDRSIPALSLRLPGLTLEVSQAADMQVIRVALAVLSTLC